MNVLAPFYSPLLLLFGSVGALVGLPALLADPERRLRRIGFLVFSGGALLLIHGELRSAAVVRAAIVVTTGAVAAVLALLALRHWLLHRAIVAERPRSPDEWTPTEGRRLWEGRLQTAEPLPAQEGQPPCVYRRVEIERWDAGRWRRVACEEEHVPALELAGRRVRMALALPLAALRRGAIELEPHRAAPDGWRSDPDPDPALLYRSRTVGVPVGSEVRVLGRAERSEQLGLRLRGVSARAVQLGRQPQLLLGRHAGLCAAAALVSSLLGLWGAWP